MALDDGFRVLPMSVSMFRPGAPAPMMTGMSMRARMSVARRRGGRGFGLLDIIGRSIRLGNLRSGAMRVGDRAERREAEIIGVGRLDLFTIVDRARSGDRDGGRRDQRRG